MRQVVAPVTLLAGMLCSGCGIAEGPLEWVVRGRVIDAANGESLLEADVAVRLMQSGETFGEDGFAVTDEDGSFETFVQVGWTGSVAILFFDLSAGTPLGEPPHEIEFLVRTPTTEGSVTVQVDAASVIRPDDYTGTIDVSELQVELTPRIDTTYGTGEMPTAIGSGDLDGDGDVDLVLTTRDFYVGPDEVLVFANHGDGSFADFNAYAAGDSPNDLAVGDVNGDGRPDLAMLIDFGDGASIMINDGNGGFPEQVLLGIGTTLSRSSELILVDVDGDSHLDLTLAHPSANAITVRPNDGVGGFGTPTTYPAGDFPVALVPADLDRDADVDFTVINSGDLSRGDSRTVSVLLNYGDGTFAGPIGVTGGTGSGSPVSGDLDGDGDVDLAVLNIDSDELLILLNNGDGTFDSGASYAAERAAPVAVGDLTDDSHLDLILRDYGTIRNVLVMANNGDGTFREVGRLTATGWPSHVAVADLDADSRLDLVVASSETSHLTVFLNPEFPPG